METIFENYESFLKENQDEFNSPQDIVRLMNDDGMYRSFVDSLVEGLDTNVRTNVINVLNREREMILNEAANVSASSFASGWTVMAFPILVDIYSEPIISELCTVYPVDKPALSIPRVKIKAQTKSYDGSQEQTTYMPTASNLVRAGVVEVLATPGSNTNVFTASGLDSSTLKMNRRYTLMTKLLVNETAESDDSLITEHDIPVNLRPDNRNQIAATIDFLDNAGVAVEGQVTSHVNYEKGTISFQVIFNGGSADSNFTAETAQFTLRFVPVGTMNGRTTVKVETEQTDVFIDPNEDFLIDLTEEDVQDFSSIFQIDLLRTISEAVKRQILLNKDYDLAYFLKASESDIEKQGAKKTIDLDNFAVSSNYAPTTVVDVLKSVVPQISTLMGTIRRNFNMYPTYLIAGLKTASLLRSLQDMMTNMPGRRGEIGFNGATSQFLKLKILEGAAIDENKIYLSTKAPQNSLEKSSIIDLVYQPMYVVKEITDGNTRHFVRARTMLEVSRTDGLGCLEINNIEKYIG